MNKKNIKATYKTYAVIAALSISLASSAAIIPALSSMANAFPRWETWIQLLATIPSLMMMVSSLLVNRMLDITSEKKLTTTSLIVLLFSGIFPYFTNQFILILLSRAFMGLALGVINTVSSSLPANEFPEGSQRTTATGIQSAFSSLGSIIFSMLSGWAAIYSWKNVFLVQIINLFPLLIVCFFMLSTQRNSSIESLNFPSKVKTNQYFTKKALPIMILSFFCIILTCTYPLNLSLYIEKMGFGSTALAGTLTSVNALIGFIIGLLFSKISYFLKKRTLIVALFISGLSMFVIAFASSIPFLFTGSMLFGIGTSMIYPTLLMQLYHDIPANQIVIAVGMFSVGTNISQFISPFIINPIANTLGDSEAQRLVVAAAGIMILCVFLIIFPLSRNSFTKNMPPKK